MKYKIAIDGPAASGKSSAAENVAKILNFQRLDSGMLYRAITFIIISKFPDYDLKCEAIRNYVNSISLILDCPKILFEGNDINEHLRTSQIDFHVGIIAKESYIRQKIGELQHEIINSIESSNSPGIVVDGRDIGTVIMPDAFLKIFITASDTVRAIRRAKQLKIDYENVLIDIRTRDNYDINREHGALKCAEDAITLNNDYLTLDETVDQIIKLFNDKKLSVTNKK